MIIIQLDFLSRIYNVSPPALPTQRKFNNVNGNGERVHKIEQNH